jgi:hypothetical protein
MANTSLRDVPTNCISMPASPDTARANAPVGTPLPGAFVANSLIAGSSAATLLKSTLLVMAVA